MSDDRWWRERREEEYFEYRDETKQREVKELVQCEDGVYRVEQKE